MSNKELLEYYKEKRQKAQRHLQRYLEELKIHFDFDNPHIIEILEKEVKNIKEKNNLNLWTNFINRIKNKKNN